MSKTSSMFLLEVYDVTDPSDSRIHKRRISESIMSIEDWIDDNAHKWCFYAVDVHHDGYGNGKICIRGDKNAIFEFTSRNIAVI